MPEPAGRSLLDHFAALRDPRQQAKALYPLPEILLPMLGATLAGAGDLVEIALGQAAAWLPAPLPALPPRLPSHRWPRAIDPIREAGTAKGREGTRWGLYRPRLLGHRVEAYAAKAAG